MAGTAAPKTFLDQRDGHLKKSAAFRAAAKNRLADNLPYRTALSDAVESIRHALQAYVWSRVATQYPREPAGRWQEVAAKGSMPDLLAAAAEGGLNFSSQQQHAIMEMVRVRNSYTHDSPNSGMLITREIAEKAVNIALEVERRTQGGKAEPAPAPAPASATKASDGPRPPQVVGPVAPPSTTVPAGKSASEKDAAPGNTRATEPAPETDTNPVGPGVEDPGVDDPDVEVGPITFSNRRGRRLWVALGVAAALVLGLVAGTAVTYPVASGRAALPGWVPFAGQLAPATPTGTLPTATPYTGPLVAGNLIVTPASCGAAQPTVTLQNTGATTITWAAGSPDALGAAFAASADGASHATLTGQLAPDASVTVYVTAWPSNGAHLVVIADGGTVSLALPAAC